MAKKQISPGKFARVLDLPGTRGFTAFTLEDFAQRRVAVNGQHVYVNRVDFESGDGCYYRLPISEVL